jgi:signal transduction histidine kinase
LSDFSFFLLYLCYGLAFFTTGVAVTSKITRVSKLEINRYLWLFALFAFIHAFNEWLELFFVLDFADLPAALAEFTVPLQFLPAVVSYLFLMLFGICTLSMICPDKRWWFWLSPLPLFALIVLFHPSSDTASSVEIYRASERLTRNFIGFPAACMAGLGLIGYAGKVRATSTKVSRGFVYAGGVLILYGVLTGLIPSGTRLPPMNLPVEVLRAATAIAMLHFIMLALRLFDYERQEKIEKSLERFAQAEKLTSLGKLAAGIAHEINNPLTNVSLNVEMLRKSLPSEEPYVKRFAAIERNLERASRIARELLAFSRQEQKEEATAPLDLNEVIRDTLLLLGPRQQKADFKLELTPLPPVNGLYWKIEEVLLNIMINAIEASKRKKSIHIGSRVLGSNAVITIRDEGVGIPPENLRSIFDPFFTTKEVGQGTGLGLSICFGIMERHGGKIDVSSKPGAGTTVTLTFPTGPPHGI